MIESVTIKMISQHMGYSVSTISKALNGYPDIGESTRKHIIETATQMGYVPNLMARSLVKKTSHIISVIMPDIATSIYSEIYKSIQHSCRVNNLNVFLCDCDRNLELEIEYVKVALENQVMGILIAPLSDDISHIRSLVSDRIPVVYLGGKVNDARENFVSSNNTYGAELGMDYLFSLGHRRITAITDDGSSLSCLRRIEAYAGKMDAHHLEKHILISESREDNVQKTGYLLTKKLIASHSIPTAIFAVKDLLAVGVMQALNESGIRVPEDVSILGYDDISLAALPMLELTTIAQPKKEMGDNALRILLEQVEKQGMIPKSNYYAHPQLVVRKSCRRV